MPTYEYVCEACGHHWEAFQRIKDEPLRDCPQCSKPKAKRQISAGAGFILKGRGWYSDLYGSKKSNGQAEAKAAHETMDKPGATKADKPEAPPTKPSKDSGSSSS